MLDPTTFDNSLSLESLYILLKQNLKDIRQNQIIIENKGKLLSEFKKDFQKNDYTCKDKEDMVMYYDRKKIISNYDLPPL